MVMDKIPAVSPPRNSIESNGRRKMEKKEHLRKKVVTKTQMSHCVKKIKPQTNGIQSNNNDKNARRSFIAVRCMCLT